MATKSRTERSSGTGIKTYSAEFAGKPLFIEIGRLAGQANGSCRVQYGETTVLATATAAKEPKEGTSYFPLSVDYEEKYYAAGKIKGSKWIKRETRPSDEAILTSRFIDRSLRPRFDQNIRNDIQVVAMVLSFDGINDPDIPALFGASLALMISDIPFDGPIAAARVGRINGKLIINPTYEERQQSDFDIVVAGTENKINMIEAGAKVVPEEDIVKASVHAMEELKELIKLQNKIAKELARDKKELGGPARDEAFAKIVRDFTAPKLEKVLYTPHKHEYVEGLDRIENELEEFLKAEFAAHPDIDPVRGKTPPLGPLEKSTDKAVNNESNKSLTGRASADTPLAGRTSNGVDKKLAEAKLIFEEEIDRIVHKNILESEKRPDGRKVDELREITADVGLLPHSHGTGLFNRGTTQALTSLTLAAPGMEQWIETMEIMLTKKRFMHHYVFPPFCVGETGRMGSGGRREIGHGALAEKALEPLIPSKDDFPYTIRLVSEILSSNGSSSMASVCGSSLALMDGGVPMKMPAAGIAMGLMFDEKGDKYKILTDIQGPEDHHGDMDLKVAGTKDGVTAMQMDVKIEGINEKILKEALAQAKRARLEILEVMAKAIAVPRKELSPYAPRVQIIKINPEKIGALIGPQGKNINEIIEQTGAEIDIDDDGSVFITSDKPENMEKAIALIRNSTYEARPGDEFDGKVSRLLDFGAMIEYMPGKEGLVHVSEISKEHIRRPSDVLKIGQTVHVRVKNIDDYGRINLTMK